MVAVVVNPRAGDEHLGKYVYCKQHVAVHTTGWCMAEACEKVGLGADSLSDAIMEAELCGLTNPPKFEI